MVCVDTPRAVPAAAAPESVPGSCGETAAIPCIGIEESSPELVDAYHPLPGIDLRSVGWSSLAGRQVPLESRLDVFFV